MGGKDAAGAGVSHVAHLGMLEVYDEGMGCCIFGLPMGEGFLTVLEGRGPKIDGKGEGDE
ncbi:hypothetical protein KI387_000003, partial [Taxus chinensis]